MTSPPAASPSAPDGPTPVRPPEPRPGRVWAYLGIVVGATVSIAANVAHSFVRPPDMPAGHPWRPEPGAVAGAMFWPVALLITTEIMTRTSWPPGAAWTLLRFAGLLPVAAVAGIVSYLHLHGLLHHYHEAPLTCVIAPFSVDGLMVMASSALVAGGRTERQPVPGTTSDSTTATAMEVATAGHARQQLCEGCRTRPATVTWTRPPAGHPFRLCSSCADGAAADSHRSAPNRTPRRASTTAEQVVRLATDRPDLSTTDIARHVGVSARTVRRHLAGHRPATPA